MKSLGVASISALLLLSFLTPRLDAQTPGASARGSYKLLMEDGLTKTVDFSAVTDDRGTTAGDLLFTDEVKVSEVDDPEDPRAGDPFGGFYIKVGLDSLTVDKNRALLSGKVLDSSHRNYLGSWVQLVVEDNGVDNQERPDLLVWTICRPLQTGWIPSDLERERDDGAFLSWWATDLERDDDVGIPSVNLIPREDTRCAVFPLRAYEFAEPLRWSGDIVVKLP